MITGLRCTHKTSHAYLLMTTCTHSSPNTQNACLHTCLHSTPGLTSRPQAVIWGKCSVTLGPAPTSGCRAGRQSSQGDTHCPGPSSPSRRLGSACCKQHSFLWCRRACQGKGTEGSGACQGIASQGSAHSLVALWAW